MVNRHVGFAALGNLLWFIGGREAFPQGFQEGLEGGPVCMLRGVASGQISLQGLDIAFNTKLQSIDN